MRRMSLVLCLALLAGLTCAADFTAVPLGKAANRDLLDDVADDGKGGWSDQGRENCLTGFPRGRQTFKDIPFDIPESGPAAIMLKGAKLAKLNLPEQVEIAAPNVSAANLYLLNTYVWGGNEAVAKVFVEYDANTKDEFTLKIGRDTAGWWDPKDDLAKAAVAWKGKNGQGAQIGVFVTPIVLKHPGKPVSKVTIQAVPQEGSLAILGLSFGNKPPSKIVPAQAEWEPWDADIPDWFPVEWKFDKDTVAVWEKAFKMDAPAGKHGWLQADGENLKFSDGTPIRFKGATLSSTMFYPQKALSEHYARRLAKYGFNQVRFHSLMDEFLPNRGQGDTTKINESRLDKFDRFFAELKKAGIYVKASMVFGHLWGPETGVTDADKLEALNNTQYFYDEKHQELYLVFLKQFFTHKNPHTGLTYAEDPAFNMFKVVNECSLFFYTTDASPPSYRIKLQDKWNDWLRKKYGADAGLAKAWQVEGQASPLDAKVETLNGKMVALRGVWSLANAPAADAKRVADQTAFYAELETTWFARVQKALRDVGSKALMQGSSWGGPGHLQELQTAANVNFDFAGKHTYWLHPHGGWSPMAVTFENLPIVKHAQDNFFNFVYQHPAGKPFTCTEWNFCWPNDFTLDAAPFMAAYGSMQNIVANHRFNVGNVDCPQFLNTIFGMYDNPAGLALEPLAYFLYVRGDVKTAPVIYRRAIGPGQLHDPARNRGRGEKKADSQFYMVFGDQEIPNDAMFVGKVELSFDPAKYPAVWDEKTYNACHDRQRKTLTSATKELVWNYDKGWIRIDTPRTQGLMGFFSDQSCECGALKLKLNDAYGVAHFSSLDALPLTDSKSILVSLVGRTRNTGQVYASRGESFKLQKQGDAPLLMEPATADFELKTKIAGWKLSVVGMNGDIIAGKDKALKAEGGILKGRLSNKETGAIHFLLEAQ